MGLDSAMMDSTEAALVLRDSPTQAVMEGSLSYIKEVHGLCLHAGLPAAIMRPRRKDGG
jgi:hypothetical protein